MEPRADDGDDGWLLRDYGGLNDAAMEPRADDGDDVLVGVKGHQGSCRNGAPC